MTMSSSSSTSTTLAEARVALKEATTRKERVEIARRVACSREQEGTLEFLFGTFLGSEAGCEARDGSFPVSEFEAVLRTFLAANKTTRAVDALLQRYILAHLDLLHFFLAFLSNVFRNDKVFDHGLFFDLLQKTGTFLMGEALLEETSIEGEEDLPLFFPELSKKQFKLKKQYTKCWLDLLKNFDPQTKCSELRKLAAGAATTTSASSIAKLNDKQRSQLFAAKTDRLKKKTMLHLTNIFQYLQNPLVLADFFLAEFDRGSLEVQICALSGLLYLTTQTKLEFQDDYYERLYLLVRPEAFEVEYRVRFQRILASSLILSTSLPGVSAACFAKKLLRICVGAAGGEASGAKKANSAKSGAAAVVDVPTICWCLALCFNIVRKNEATCKRLLHRGGTGRGSKKKGKVAAAEDLHEDKEVSEIMNSQTTTDPFDVSASLPASRQSVKQSCLWELEALSKHHHPLVARLVPFFRNPNMFKKIAQGIDANEFLDVSVDELLEKELKNKRKRYDDLIVRSEMNSGDEDHEMPGFAYFPRRRNQGLERSYRGIVEGGLTLGAKRRKPAVDVDTATGAAGEASSDASTDSAGNSAPAGKEEQIVEK